MITDIRLQHFRSYKDSAYELDKGVNIIVGPNGSGKTNLLEALLVLTNGSSYRAKTSELIKFKSSWARLDAHTVEGGQRTVKINASEAYPVKTFDINSRPYKRLPLAQTLPTVLFEPQHLLLLSGRPDLRREFIDDLLEQSIIGFGETRRAYKRAVYQRNNLLKKGPQLAQSQLFAWDIRVSELGGQIVKHRLEIVEKLAGQIGSLYKHLSSSKANVNLSYDSSLALPNYSTNLLNKLESSSDLDFIRGFTSHGPHRDDLKIEINKHIAQDVASRGENRTILLALKIMELQILQKLRDQKPLLLLDDVFSELDGSRRRALTGYLKDYQTFITTTDADLVIHDFAQKCNIIPLG